MKLTIYFKLLLGCIFVTIFVLPGFNQEYQHPEIGFNNLMFDYRVSTIDVCYIDIDNETGKIDTILPRKYFFDEKGFLVRKIIPNLYNTKIIINYEYNDLGYLSYSDTIVDGISRSFNSSINDSTDRDTSYIYVKSDYMKVGNKKMLTFQSTKTIYSDGKVVETTIHYFYKEGMLIKLKSLHKVNSTIIFDDEVLYYYTDSGLLKTREFYEESKLKGKRIYRYSFW
jgi:hypothetical protein